MTRLAIVEAKLLLRDPVGLTIGLVPPVVTACFGYREASLLVAIAIPGLVLLPTRLARYRERGVLRGLATTPVHPVSPLGALVAVHAAVAVVGVALAFGALVCSATLGAFPRPLPLAIVAMSAAGLGAVAAGLFRRRQHL